MRRSLRWVVTLVVGGTGVITWMWLAHPTGWVAARWGAADPHHEVREPPDAYGRVPDFSLIDRSGRPITRFTLLGKIWVVNFFYTRCPDTCPLQSATMARLQRQLSAERDVRFVSITVDPEHDTPGILAAYATRYRADPDRWLFLTGSRAAVTHLAVDGFHLGVERAPDRAALGTHRLARLLHSSRFVLVDRQLRIRGYFESTDAEGLARLRDHLKFLLHHG